MAAAQDPESAGKKKGKGPLVMILLVVLLLVLGGGGAAAFFFVGRGKSEAKSDAGHGDETHAEAEQEAEGDGHGGGGGKGSKSHGEPGVLSLEPFVTNLAPPDGDRYVKCTVRLEFDAKEAAEKVKTSELHLTRVRDRILALLSGKRLEEVSSPAGKLKIKEEIRAEIDPLLSSGHIKDVYYTEFLVQ